MTRMILEFLGIRKKRTASKSRRGVLVEIVHPENKNEEMIRMEVERVFGCPVLSSANENGYFIYDAYTHEVLLHSIRPFEELELDEVKQMTRGTYWRGTGNQ